MDQENSSSRLIAFVDFPRIEADCLERAVYLPDRKLYQNYVRGDAGVYDGGFEATQLSAVLCAVSVGKHEHAAAVLDKLIEKQRYSLDSRGMISTYCGADLSDNVLAIFAANALGRVALAERIGESLLRWPRDSSGLLLVNANASPQILEYTPTPGATSLIAEYQVILALKKLTCSTGKAIYREFADEYLRNALAYECEPSGVVDQPCAKIIALRADGRYAEAARLAQILPEISHFDAQRVLYFAPRVNNPTEFEPRLQASAILALMAAGRSRDAQLLCAATLNFLHDGETGLFEAPNTAPGWIDLGSGTLVTNIRFRIVPTAACAELIYAIQCVTNPKSLGIILPNEHVPSGMMPELRVSI